MEVDDLFTTDEIIDAFMGNEHFAAHEELDHLPFNFNPPFVQPATVQQAQHFEDAVMRFETGVHEAPDVATEQHQQRWPTPHQSPYVQHPPLQQPPRILLRDPIEMRVAREPETTPLTRVGGGCQACRGKKRSHTCGHVGVPGRISMPNAAPAAGHARTSSEPRGSCFEGAAGSCFEGAAGWPGGTAHAFGGAALTFGGAALASSGASPAVGRAAPATPAPSRAAAPVLSGAAAPAPGRAAVLPFSGAALAFGGASPAFGSAALASSGASPAVGRAAPAVGRAAPANAPGRAAAPVLSGAAAPASGRAAVLPFSGAALAFGGASPAVGRAAPATPAPGHAAAPAPGGGATPVPARAAAPGGGATPAPGRGAGPAPGRAAGPATRHDRAARQPSQPHRKKRALPANARRAPQAHTREYFDEDDDDDEYNYNGDDYDGDSGDNDGGDDDGGDDDGGDDAGGDDDGGAASPRAQVPAPSMKESIAAVLKRVTWASLKSAHTFADISGDDGVDGDPMTTTRKRVTVNAICWQPTSEQLAPHLKVSAADLKGRSSKAELNPSRYAWLCAFADNEKAPYVQATGRHAHADEFVQGRTNPSYAATELAHGNMLHARHAHELVVEAIKWERERLSGEIRALREQNTTLRSTLRLAPILDKVDEKKNRGGKYHRSRLRLRPSKLKPYSKLQPAQKSRRLHMIRVACLTMQSCAGGMCSLPSDALAPPPT